MRPMETTAAPLPHAQRLERSRSDRWIGGVAGGLGRYFGVDPVLFRLAFVGLVFLGGSGVCLYIVAWLAIPGEGVAQSPLGRLFAAGQHRRRGIRNLVIAGAAAVAVLVGLAIGGLAAASAWSDTPFRGTVGDRSYAPATATELRDA